MKKPFLFFLALLISLFSCEIIAITSSPDDLLAGQNAIIFGIDARWFGIGGLLLGMGMIGEFLHPLKKKPKS